MSATMGRLVFAFLLVVNCIIWSRSRYGQPIQLQNSTSLLKRINYELQRTDAYIEAAHEASIPFLNKFFS